MSSSPSLNDPGPLAKFKESRKTNPAHHPHEGNRPTDENLPRAVSGRGHPHGRKASWALVAVVLLAFILGGVAMILHIWPLLIACAVVVVLSVPVGGLIRIMSDTVGWTDAPPTYINRGHVIREAVRLYEREHSDKDHHTPRSSSS